MALFSSILVIFHFWPHDLNNFGSFWPWKGTMIPQMSVKHLPLYYSIHITTLSTHLGRLGMSIALFSSIFLIFYFWCFWPAKYLKWRKMTGKALLTMNYVMKENPSKFEGKVISILHSVIKKLIFWGFFDVLRVFTVFWGANRQKWTKSKNFFGLCLFT